jgi:LDH2 family malate/lactate/ureidoglycolate dehydrogenase
MIVLPAEELRELGVRIFTAQGAPEEKARFIVDTLIEANLAGHDSHGAHYFLGYSDRIMRGFIDVNAEPVIVKETPSSAHIDGRWAFGQVTAMRLTASEPSTATT